MSNSIEVDEKRKKKSISNQYSNKIALKEKLNSIPWNKLFHNEKFDNCETRK